MLSLPKRNSSVRSLRKEKEKAHPSQKESKSGTVFKKGPSATSSWQQRYAVLDSEGTLFYYKTNKDGRPTNDGKPKGHIDTFLYKFEPFLDDRGGRQFCFQLRPKQTSLEPLKDNKRPDRIWYFAAVNAADFEEWKNAINSIGQGYDLGGKAEEIEANLKRQNYVIQADDLQIYDQKLGKGAGGVVKKGLWLGTTTVAIKSLNNIPEFIDQEEMLSFFQEIQVLSQLRHPNIVSMFGFCRKDNMVLLVTEFVAGGDLAHALRSDKTIDDHLALTLASSICVGMVYLHNNNIIHRDLKPGNILIENWEAANLKVCDFGLSGFVKKTGDGAMDDVTYGTPAFAAPELPHPNHTMAVDVYSFAIILWQFFTRDQPWKQAKSVFDIRDKVQKGGRLELSEEWVCSNLIKRCWDMDPSVRPTFKEIFEELKSIKSKLQPSATDLQDSIKKSFEGQSKLSWPDFNKKLVTMVGTSTRQLERLKYLLVENGTVSLERWEKLLKWFSPLMYTDSYHTTGTPSPSEETPGYTVDEIVDIVSPTFFHGFLSTAETRAQLADKPSGTYLLRFSSSAPGSYTLSVSLENGVGHWRISPEKVASKKPPTLKMEGNSYESFYDLIKDHKIVPLKSVSTTVKDIVLKEECSRKEVNPVYNT